MGKFSEVLLASLGITITFIFTEQMKPTNCSKLAAKFNNHTGANILGRRGSELPHLAALRVHLHLQTSVLVKHNWERKCPVIILTPFHPWNLISYIQNSHFFPLPLGAQIIQLCLLQCPFPNFGLSLVSVRRHLIPTSPPLPLQPPNAEDTKN